ncbi:MAG: EscU/YscU/HrcU family type III secretion system export apparatus switch protein [Planctomycetia bacterium]
MADPSERTIPATPRRREAARQQGMMPLSSLPAWIAACTTAVAIGPAWARATLPAAGEMLRGAIGAAGRGPIDEIDLPGLIVPGLLLPTAAVVIVSGGVGLVVRALLDGMAWRSARIMPAVARIDPLSGLARIFSLSTITTMVGNALALAVIVAVGAWAMQPLVVGGQEAVRGIDLAADPVPLFVRGQQAILPLAAAAAMVAAMQWAMARWRFEKRIRMTPQEFQDEARSMQADPKVKFTRNQTKRPAPTAGRSAAPDSRTAR